MTGRIDVDGTTYLELETVADVFRVDAVVLEEAYAVGLLGPCLVRDARVLVAAASMDRVATVVRLRVVLECDLETVELALMQRGL
ncbi:MAG: hypothetical protein AAGB93_01510 [Planctomycetota bacterium]